VSRMALVAGLLTKTDADAAEAGEVDGEESAGLNEARLDVREDSC
jgi:hypothetical protein